MEDYSIRLGVEIDVDDIRTQISGAEKNIKPIPIKVEIENLKEIQQQLQNLGGTKSNSKVAIPIDTSKVEQSLKEVVDAINDIKSSLGSMDKGSGMKSLLSSINQIADSLGKATDESETLVKTLNALSKKDFSLNIGVNMGGKGLNQVGYGRQARKKVLPELEAQAQYLNDLISKEFQLTNSTKSRKISINPLQNSVRRDLGNIQVDFLKNFDDSSMIKQMESYEAYINRLRELAKANNVDLSGFDAQFSKSAHDLIDEVTGIKESADVAEEQMNRLKGIFGGGIDTESLTQILNDLKEIKEALNALASNESLGGLTQNFKELSATLEKIASNVVVVQNGLNAGLSGSGSGISSITEELKVADIKIGATEEQIENLKVALQSFGFNESSIDTVTKDFEELGITVKNVKSRLNDDGSVTLTVKGIDQYERAVTAIKSISKDAESGEISIKNLGTSVSQSFKEVEESFARLKSKAQEISKLKIQIAGLDADKNANEISALTAQLDKLETEYNDLYAATSKDLNEHQLEELGQIAANTSDKIDTLNAKLADASAVQKQSQAYKDLMSVVKEIGKLELKIAGLDSGKSANEVELLSNKLQELKADYQTLKETLEGQLSATQFGNLQAELDETEFKISVVEAKLKDAQAQLAKGIQIKIADGGTYARQVEDLNHRFEKLSAKSNESKLAIDELNAAFRAMRTATSDDARIAAEAKYQLALQQTRAEIERNEQAQKDSISSAKLASDRNNLSLTMDNWLKENSAAAKQFGSRIRELQVELKSCDGVRLSGIKREFTQIRKEAELAGKTTKSFGDRLKDQLARYSSYFSIASVFMYAEQGLRSMFEQVKAIDSAMTELKKVTSETDAAYERFLTNAADRAKKIGTTIDGLVDSTAEFAKIGYSFEESQDLAEVANVYKLVGDNIESAEDATLSLISTMAAFKGEINGMSNPDFAMSIVDKFNEVANKYSIGSGGLGDALQRSASSMAAANNSLDETIALITAANEVVQNPEKIGNGLKTGLPRRKNCLYVQKCA